MFGKVVRRRGIISHSGGFGAGDQDYFSKLMDTVSQKGIAVLQGETQAGK